MRVNPDRGSIRTMVLEKGMASRIMWAQRLILIAVLVTLPSCGRSDGIEEQDSRSSGREDEVESWQLSDMPEFRLPAIGINQDSIYFGALGPLGTFTEDGDIVIAIRQGDYRVVYLDSLGSGVVTFGGAGQGPGEFRRITVLTLNADTAAAWDWVNGRVSRYTRRQFVDQVPFRLPRSQTYVGLLEDGTIVVTPQEHPAAATMFPEDVIMEGQQRPYHILGRSGERIATLLGAPESGPSNLPLTVAGQDQPTIFMNFSSGCWPTAMHMTRNERLLIADSREGHLFSMDRTGTQTPLYRSTYRDTIRQEYVNLIESQIESFVARSGALTAESQQKARSRAGSAGAPFPTVWSAMVSDLQGDVWLERASCYVSWFSDPITTWEVVGADGKPKATVDVPRNVTILSVDGDRVLVSEIDDLQVQYLALYRVRR